MKRQIQTALFHIPLLYFQYMGIISSIQKEIEYPNIDYLEPKGLLVLSAMLVITLYMILKLNSIHNYTKELYGFVFVSLVILVNLFENSLIFSIVPFIIYTGGFFYMEKSKKSFNFYSNDNKNNSKHLVKDFEQDIDSRFKKFDSDEESTLFEDIKNCEIFEVNKLGEEIGIVYIKENRKKFLNIEPIYDISSIHGISTLFKIDAKPLDAKVINSFYSKEKKKMIEQEFIQTTHDLLINIKQILNIYHLSDSYDEYYRNDIIEIIYRDNKNQTNSYRLHFINVEDSEIKLDIKKYENIFSFKTRVLDDNNKTQINYSYDKKFFSPTIEYDYFEEIDDKLNQTRRKIGDYYLDYPCTTFGEKIYFTQEEGGILAYNISHNHLLNPLFLPNKEIYSFLNTEEKSKLHHFLAIAQLYLNDVYVNKKFDNTFIIDGFENPKETEKIEKLEKVLEDCNWIEEYYYSNAEQGHRYPTRAVIIYHKEDDKNKNFVLFNENDWLNFKYTIKYNDNAKKEVEKLLRELL